MAGMYTNGVQQIMAANVDLVNDEIAVLLIDTAKYMVDLENHESQADIPLGAVLSEIVLTGNTLDDTTFRADDPTFSAVTGDQVGAIVILKDTGEYSTSVLLAYLDENTPGSPVDFPIIPDGGDITLRWDTGTAGIFKL